MMRLATEQDNVAWNDFVKSSGEGTFLQSWEWGEVQKKLSIPFWRIVIENNNEWQAVALVIKRDVQLKQSWLYIPKGPVALSATMSRSAGQSVWKDIEQALIDLARHENAMFIRIDPEWQTKNDFMATWYKAQREVQPQHTLILNLSKTEEELLAEMHHKTRYNIRLAQKKGVNIRFSTNQKDLDHFLRLTHDVNERSQFRFHPSEYYRVLLEILGSAGQLEIAVAEYEGDVLAAHLLITFNNVTTYAHGASSSQARSVMAPHLLQWETIKRAKAAGSKWYDFYGISPKWPGVTRFKEGFGGEKRSFIGAQDYILAPAWYWAYNVMHRLRK